MKFEIPRSQFTELLANAALFLGEANDRYPLQQVELTYTGDTLQAVSTNSFVLAVFTYKILGGNALAEPFTFVLSDAVELVALLRALEPARLNNVQVVTVEVDDDDRIDDHHQYVRVTAERVVWKTRRYIDDYINWQALTNEPNTDDVDVSYYSFKFIELLSRVRFVGAPIEGVKIERTPKLQPNRFRATSDDHVLAFYIMPVRADW